jgi:hypothetical protein
MSEQAPDREDSPPADPDGIRVVARDRRGRLDQRIFQGVALFLVAACAGYVLMPRRVSQAGPESPTRAAPTRPAMDLAGRVDEVAGNADDSRTDAVDPAVKAKMAESISRRLTPRRVPDRAKKDEPIPDGQDPTQQQEFVGIPRDVTAGEYIQALHDAGIYEGIGAFNPPGTSPPLEGLSVPEDFELPEGYVRHYQSTDDGQPIEAILMYSPDYVFFDENGNPVPIPDDRVVPPEHAPPGFPIRPIEIPKPKEPGTGDLGR